MICCIVGKLSKTKQKFELELRKHGFQVRKKITKNTTHLIVPDMNNIDEQNENIIKAREFGLDIVDEAWCVARFTTTLASIPCIPMLAKNYKEQVVAGWWVSEKLDGLRAVWDGHQFWSRSGNPFDVPKEFTAEFPNVVLDGELFCGRGNFDVASGIVRTQGGTYDDWKNTVNYHVFDAPQISGDFETRYAFLKTLSDKNHITVCEQTQISDTNELQQRLDEIVHLSGEGLMLRKPHSMYESKRSSTLLKVKKMHDAECVVIGHEDGRGKYRGMCGALVCEYKGRMFKVGSGLTDADRKNPPKMGAAITFGYFEITKNGVPRHPTFKRIFKGRA